MPSKIYKYHHVLIVYMPLSFFVSLSFVLAFPLDIFGSSCLCFSVSIGVTRTASQAIRRCTGLASCGFVRLSTDIETSSSGPKTKTSQAGSGFGCVLVAVLILVPHCLFVCFSFFFFVLSRSLIIWSR